MILHDIYTCYQSAEFHASSVVRLISKQPACMHEARVLALKSRASLMHGDGVCCLFSGCGAWQPG